MTTQPAQRQHNQLNDYTTNSTTTRPAQRQHDQLNDNTTSSTTTQPAQRQHNQLNDNTTSSTTTQPAQRFSVGRSAIDYRIWSGLPINRHGAWRGLQKNTFFGRLSHGVRSVLQKNRNSALISMPTCYRVHRLSHFLWKWRMERFAYIISSYI